MKEIFSRKFEIGQLQHHFNKIQSTRATRCNVGEMSKSYPIYDDHNKLFCVRLQETLENRINGMLVCVIFNEKVRGKCKKVDDSEVKLLNHMVHHVYKTRSSMTTDPCFWCGDIDCGVYLIKNKSLQWIHVHRNDFQFPPIKLSPTKKISIKNPSTNHPIYCNSCKNTYGYVTLNYIVHNFITAYFLSARKRSIRLT